MPLKTGSRFFDSGFASAQNDIDTMFVILSGAPAESKDLYESCAGNILTAQPLVKNKKTLRLKHVKMLDLKY